MPDIFKIETERTELTWSLAEDEAVDFGPADGLLAISPIDPAARNFQIWREGVPDEVSSNLELQVGPRLFEEIPYSFFLRGKDNQKVELSHRDPTILNGLFSASGGSIVHGSINFRSQIGRSRFSVYVDGQAEYDFDVEVFPSKLD
jgi:hypothetical protein